MNIISVISSSPEEALCYLHIVIDLFTFFGFLINWEMSVTNPSQLMEFLWLKIDTLLLSYSHPRKTNFGDMNGLR